ncbi:ROK family protein [Cohnella thermotolerans]|jgi:glucokinase|uniref:ROK family protein n=1 Tax=Cohnella thermotolerans TaxID=329858 RepID=UPI00042461EE|nr:ROK family protein [Cohnella thermotolerans]
MVDCVIGIDIGGTNIRVGLVDANLGLVRKETALTASFQTADDLFTHVRTMVDRVDCGRQAAGIGIALPVPWKEEMACICDATNIPCIENISIQTIKSYFSGYEVYFENDVNVIALLESEHGASKSYSHSMYITVSTGIGSGIILNNEIHQGSHGYAGEIGGMIVSDSSKSLSSLYNGTLESLCSGKALEEEGKRLYGSGATTQTLFDKYHQQDKNAAVVIDRWVEHFSNAIATLMQTIDPDVFVVGGAVIDNNQWLIDRVVERARDKVLENLRDSINIVMSAFGPDAGMIGAGLVALKNTKGDKR